MEGVDPSLEKYLIEARHYLRKTTRIKISEDKMFRIPAETTLERISDDSQDPQSTATKSPPSPLSSSKMNTRPFTIESQNNHIRRSDNSETSFLSFFHHTSSSPFVQIVRSAPPGPNGLSRDIKEQQNFPSAFIRNRSTSEPKLMNGIPYMSVRPVPREQAGASGDNDDSKDNCQLSDDLVRPTKITIR